MFKPQPDTGLPIAERSRYQCSRPLTQARIQQRPVLLSGDITLSFDIANYIWEYIPKQKLTG